MFFIYIFINKIIEKISQNLNKFFFNLNKIDQNLNQKILIKLKVYYKEMFSNASVYLFAYSIYKSEWPDWDYLK